MLFALHTVCNAQAGPETAKPVQPKADKRDVQLALKDVELWQLRAQTVVEQYQRAQAAAKQAIEAACEPGFQLNLEKWECLKAPVPAKETAPAK